MKLCNSCTQNTLMERIEQNYEDFKSTTLKLDSESIFEYAPTIAAVEDVYFYMTTHDWADAEQTEYLMQYENPLRLLADLWEEENEDRGADFGDMLDNLGGGGDSDDDDFAFDFPDELRGDYKEMESALIREFIELGRDIFKC